MDTFELENVAASMATEESPSGPVSPREEEEEWEKLKHLKTLELGETDPAGDETTTSHGKDSSMKTKDYSELSKQVGEFKNQINLVLLKFSW